MNQEKIGKFIAKCRKDKKMTQSELAEKLGVTDKSIGNWENGRNITNQHITSFKKYKLFKFIFIITFYNYVLFVLHKSSSFYCFQTR